MRRKPRRPAAPMNPVASSRRDEGSGVTLEGGVGVNEVSHDPVKEVGVAPSKKMLTKYWSFWARLKVAFWARKSMLSGPTWNASQMSSPVLMLQKVVPPVVVPAQAEALPVAMDAASTVPPPEKVISKP